MTGRWTLNRAGIVNVYQYDDETLAFAGGRLLLRGVNGSGKSTAMNMLLPFLLEADTRRIDAAGEQAGVLRSWMLSGRDEQQPVGYLWIELRWGADHLVCGCGIRANRSTDRVTTWWFVTSRRPGIDFALVENRTPLSVDALRVLLGPSDVFSQDQRPAYRTEVRGRLYGGADIDQHVRLLHVVRNPRVGDRIDVDLPGYLAEALPRLSEEAIDDAAQPLEDLEEHRRNVEDLTRTATALEAIEAVYAGYARSELHRRADGLEHLVGEHRDRASEERRIRTELAQAETDRDRALGRIDEIEADERRLRQEIEALKSNDAYQAGADLTQLREHVASLDNQLSSAARRVEQAVKREHEARDAVPKAQSEMQDDLAVTQRSLDDLTELCVLGGLPIRPPGPPVLPASSDDTEVALATEVPDTEQVTRALGQVRAAAHTRLGDIDDVGRSLDDVERTERDLRESERLLGEAEEAEREALEWFNARRRDRDETVEAWRGDLQAWTARLDAHRSANQLAAVDPSILAVPDLAGDRDAVGAALLAVAQATVEHHALTKATLDARRTSELALAGELEQRLADLDAQVLPDPPSLPWQRDERAVCLSELVDFAAGLDPSARAGLEAALEAAGLLGAEVLVDGSLRLVDGQLMVASGSPASEPLGDLLTITIPEEHRGRVDRTGVGAVLAAISTSPGDLEGTAATTVVTTDGRFRTGVLHGRYHKAEAEHIGVAARRAALQRQRAEVAGLLEAARATLASTEDELAAGVERIAEARQLARDLPASQLVAKALVEVEHAEGQLGKAREQVGERRQRRQAAEAAHADALDESRRRAATLGLPPDRKGLQRIAESVGEIRPLCDLVDQELRALVRSTKAWLRAGSAWKDSADDLAGAQHAHHDLAREREPVAVRLATLEDTVGLAYDEIVASLAVSEEDLKTTGQQLRQARESHVAAHGDVERLSTGASAASQRRQEAEAGCLAALPLLGDAVSVPGLWQSAAGTAPAIPAVAPTIAGATQLAGAVRAQVPAPGGSPTHADGVRQSLRQRRDSLGAGWDAEDHQPDDSLPVQVEVTGPLGRMPLPQASTHARTQMRSMTSLLSAKQAEALRNLLEGLVAREVAEKLHAAKELVDLMNRRLDTVTTSHGIGVALRWARRDDLDPSLAATIGLLAKPPDLRTEDEDHDLADAMAARLAEARTEEPDAPYRELIARVLDYRQWHRMTLMLRRPGRGEERLSRRTRLSEGEKKMVSYLPLFAAVAASCDAMAEREPAAPRFVLLDDAFSKVSEDNHAKLFGLLVELDLDFIATSERLWGTHATVPELAITEVVRDADLGVIVLEHSFWDGHQRVEGRR